MDDRPSMSSDRRRLETAFDRLRAELGISAAFPPEVLREAERAAERTGWADDPSRHDLRDIPFVTIDPPGSRDLDQAVHLERTGPGGFRVRYAIADVACFVDRGGIVEAEAWRRGVTYYSPDRRDPLYPPSISQEAGSLLPDVDRPAVLFDLELDAGGGLLSTRVQRARVRSRAQLTYHDALDHITSGRRYAGEPFGESLTLLREVGELRLAVERARGGVSLPILDQHVERRAAHRLGYEVVYEEPSAAEAWNAQISLLAGHAAALRMREARVGLLRTMPPAGEQDVVRLRVAALALGFQWPEDVPYSSFIHGVDRSNPNIDVLVWQARRLMRGASYRAFSGEVPTGADHSALAMPYAHCTAPLRRLADRYVLDLLVRLEAGEEVPASERETLGELPQVMEQAGKRAGQLERRIVDVTEAWQLRDRIGEHFRALVLDARPAHFEAQLEQLPIRARVVGNGSQAPLSPGDEVALRLDRVELEEGRAEFALLSGAGSHATPG